MQVVAVTMHDLFDSQPDLFVAGMANGNSRVAVFSFARYQPGLRFSSEFWHKEYEKPQGAGRSKQNALANRSILLQRCCKLLVHSL